MSQGLKSAESFYGEQNTYINNIESNKAMEEEYSEFLKEYLQKQYNESTPDGILEYAKAMGHEQNLQSYIEFLLATKKAQYSPDDRVQLAGLKNKLGILKQEIQASQEDM